MRHSKPTICRTYIILGFSFLFAYLLSFLFEGQVLYGILEHFHADALFYITAAMAAHFAGLFTGGFISRNIKNARTTMLLGMGVCIITTLPFYFAPSFLWMVGIIIAGYASGCAVASWGCFLWAFTSKVERFRSCADVLILSNILMIVANVIAQSWSPFLGLSFLLLMIPIGCILIGILPGDIEKSSPSSNRIGQKLSAGHPLWMLFLFVFIITINSGLMYQVINPAFAHLTMLTSWYWAVPYILVLVILRSLPLTKNRSKILYVGMAMIMAAFLGFMLLGRGEADYLIIDTLMLGACGIFDLFWWSILGEMLEYTKNPAKIFGIGLSANVLGVLCGGLLGMSLISAGIPCAEIAVIALCVVCVTLVLLPPLNRRLVLLLKNHTYLAVYDTMSRAQQTNIIHRVKILDPLTVREQEVLQLLVSGKTNREIAKELYISENTVKTHTRNIFSKYAVSSRAELIITLFKNQNYE